jgi:hypothetical protein
VIGPVDKPFFHGDGFMPASYLDADIYMTVSKAVWYLKHRKDKTKSDTKPLFCPFRQMIEGVKFEPLFYKENNVLIVAMPLRE